MAQSKLRSIELNAEVLRQLWVRSHCNEAGSALVARIGRMRKGIRGTLTRLVAGDVVLVWLDTSRRTPLFTVWHPRNNIRTGVDPSLVELLA
jgi:hypothetical protein